MKLTKPQSKMFARLQSGERIKVINPHYANGGTMVWEKDECPAGYKVFFNLVHWVLKLEPSDWFDKETGTYGLPKTMLQLEATQ